MQRDEIVGVDGPVFQEYTKGEVPPVRVAVALPVQVPAHMESVPLIVTLIACGLVNVILSVAEHPLASVTVTVYATAAESPVPVAPAPPVGAQE